MAQKGQSLLGHQFWLRTYGMPEAVMPAALMVKRRVKLLL